MALPWLGLDEGYYPCIKAVEREARVEVKAHGADRSTELSNLAISQKQFLSRRRD
jgi:hypothetical protein